MLPKEVIMNTLSLREATFNLPNLIENTIKNCDETLIVTDSGAVMMIDKEYWEEIQETLALLRDKKSLAALLEGHQLRDKGITPPGKTIDEVFNDL
jgi:PHD/YefM family antitoxin component YafN of YafNO toxin-antitoxin module